MTGPSRPSRRAAIAIGVGGAVLAGALLVGWLVTSSDEKDDEPPAALTSCPTPASEVLFETPDTGTKTVALTLDDGPSEFTPQVLEVLERHQVHATFFVTGAHTKELPQYARDIVEAGHTIGNHSWSHPQAVEGSEPYGPFDQLPYGEQADQMDTTTAEIEAATGRTPCFFRAPGGADQDPLTLELARARGMSVAHWTHITFDWEQPPTISEPFVASIVDAATLVELDHPNILLHDGKASVEPESEVTSYRGNTVAALDEIITFYKDRGYTFTDPAGQTPG